MINIPFGRGGNDEKIDTTYVEQQSVLHGENGTQTLTFFNFCYTLTVHKYLSLARTITIFEYIRAMFLGIPNTKNQEFRAKACRVI